ncbi:MAG TPA: hypothetical protein VEL75_05900 [Candidatus Methylomirabilis sp.]|nr:hypothetical protein [Candidatus Methylomirabilis sp.]
MIDFDIKCRKCEKPLTLRVRDDQARAFFEQHGALCEVCHMPGNRPSSSRRAA